MQNDFTSSGTESGSVVWEVNHCLATLENKALFVQGIFDELLDFCQAVLENRPLRIGNLESALHVMQVYEAALCSRGNPVAIEKHVHLTRGVSRTQILQHPRQANTV